MTGPLTAVEVAQTAESIASVQLPNGMIPWFPGGHCDPWNHTECAMALDAIGMRDRAGLLLGWTRHLRHSDGSYWTGCVHPQCVRYPGGERTTYTAAAVLLADHALYGYGPSAGLFRGETLPGVVDVSGVVEPLSEG